jgi:hypothetical protein
VKNPESYYKREGNTYLIEIRLTDIYRLFNSLDPSPFLERDLDDEAEDYIVRSVGEFPLKTPLKLVFYIPKSTQGEIVHLLPESIHNYFNYRMNDSAKRLRSFLRQGRISLLIGIVFLCFCIGLSELIARVGQGTSVNILTEGLLIIGWVAMWRPIEIFLYDWWTIYYQQKVFDKLSHITIDIYPYDSTGKPDGLSLVDQGISLPTPVQRVWSAKCGG